MGGQLSLQAERGSEPPRRTCSPSPCTSGSDKLAHHPGASAAAVGVTKGKGLTPWPSLHLSPCLSNFPTQTARAESQSHKVCHARGCLDLGLSVRLKVSVQGLEVQNDSSTQHLSVLCAVRHFECSGLSINQETSWALSSDHRLGTLALMT